MTIIEGMATNKLCFHCLRHSLEVNMIAVSVDEKVKLLEKNAFGNIEHKLYQEDRFKITLVCPVCRRKRVVETGNLRIGKHEERR